MDNSPQSSVVAMTLKKLLLFLKNMIKFWVN